MGIRDEQLKKLTCPIGIDEINSKQPVKVAISIAAQLSIWQETNGTRVG
jgi:xanthine/CO dehydrogenase XdhC/CoxF family maturation factor